MTLAVAFGWPPSETDRLEPDELRMWRKLAEKLAQKRAER